MTMPEFEFKHRDDFQKMVDAQIEETLTLEYKASAALTRDSKNVQELCKDVSAMANSAGGQIIYGVGEDKKTHKPTAVDAGVTDDKITREWVHQIIGSNIHPRIEGLTVQRIALSGAGFGFVISVAATQTGPHQAPDKKYYKRYELEAVAMEDYEVKDIMRRATTPDLCAELHFGSKQSSRGIEATMSTSYSETVHLYCTIKNRSNTPAYHVMVDFLIDADLKVPFALDPFRLVGQRDEPPGPKMMIYRRAINSPPQMPIFKEAEHEDHTATVSVQIPNEHLNSAIIWLEVAIHAPGFATVEQWTLRTRQGQLKLVGPNDPLSR
jgi:Putative DNA-binding domain